MIIYGKRVYSNPTPKMPSKFSLMTRQVKRDRGYGSYTACCVEYSTCRGVLAMMQASFSSLRVH